MLHLLAVKARPFSVHLFWDAPPYPDALRAEVMLTLREILARHVATDLLVGINHKHRRAPSIDSSAMADNVENTRR